MSNHMSQKAIGSALDGYIDVLGSENIAEARSNCLTALCDALIHLDHEQQERVILPRVIRAREKAVAMGIDKPNSAVGSPLHSLRASMSNALAKVGKDTKDDYTKDNPSPYRGAGWTFKIDTEAWAADAPNYTKGKERINAKGTKVSHWCIHWEPATDAKRRRADKKEENESKSRAAQQKAISDALAKAGYVSAEGFGALASESVERALDVFKEHISAARAALEYLPQEDKNYEAVWTKAATVFFDSAVSAIENGKATGRVELIKHAARRTAAMAAVHNAPPKATTAEKEQAKPESKPKSPARKRRPVSKKKASARKAKAA